MDKRGFAKNRFSRSILRHARKRDHGDARAKHYGLNDVKSIYLLYCSRQQWESLSEKFRKLKTASTASSLRNHIIKEGEIRPKHQHHIIFLNIARFAQFSHKDLIYNFILSITHELLHISGIRDEVKVHMLEFEIAKDFLGIHHTAKYKKKRLRKIKAIQKHIDKDQKRTKGKMAKSN